MIPSPDTPRFQDTPVRRNMTNKAIHTNLNLRAWNDVSTEEQIAVRVEYGHYLDSLPPTCSMETKIERFKNWLREHKGIEYSG